MTSITVVMSSIATSFAWRSNRSVAGMRWFALGLLSISAGSLLGLGAAAFDGYVLMVSGWLFRFSGMITIGQSVRVFRGFGVWRPASLVAFVGVVGILFCYSLRGADNVELRVGVISSAVAILAADASFSMFRRVAPSDRLTHWATGVVFAAVAAFLAIRGVANLSGLAGPGTLSTDTAETAAVICANVAFIGSAFGMLLASNARLRHTAEKNAQYDPLTNLPNRRFFEDQLLQAEQRARITGRPIGIVYIDLDKFKRVNDTMGHQAGDELLRSVSRAMAGVLRPSDCLARVGGDEFVVLVEDLEQRWQLDQLAERLSAAIEGSSNAAAGETTRASYGVAMFPEDGASIQDVLREADSEMYHAKRRHRRTPEHSRIA